MKININGLTIQLTISKKMLSNAASTIDKYAIHLMLALVGTISLFAFLYYYSNGLGLAYNDARSHLDIGRRVVEGLKPGFAQLGSVWLPLPHMLMIPTVWNDFFWHTGLSGAIQSMISFVATSLLIYLFLQKLGVGMLGRLLGVFVFVANINILYLQSTAMTELLLLATMTAGVYELYLWANGGKLFHFVSASFWIMLSTLIRYDGWFLFLYATGIILLILLRRGYKVIEGNVLFFCTLGGIGIILWFLWNLLIFGDPLYFIFGPYSAHAQQEQLEAAGNLATKGNLPFSLKTYIYALSYNSNAFIAFLGVLGAFALLKDSRVTTKAKLAITALLAPFIFNVLALYLGHSVLFVPGLTGNTWFNIRYGIMMLPSIAIFIGYLIHRFPAYRPVLIGLIFFITAFTFMSADAVTIDDARVGSSQKNVKEVSGWLQENASDKDGFVLISAASHDAIIFSSGMPMKRFIHEGTGDYWDEATTHPDLWARWIIMRTNDTSDQTFKLVSSSPGFSRYNLVGKYPFADIYEIQPDYLNQLHLHPKTD